MTMCLPVQVIWAEDASDDAGHEMPVAFGSVTVIAVRLIGETLVTTNEYAMVAPTAVYGVRTADFTIVSVDVTGVFVSVQVMLSEPEGVIENGISFEPAAGRVVLEPTAELMQVTAPGYWLITDALPAAIDSLNVYVRPETANGTVADPVPAVIDDPDPAVVVEPPLAAAPPGEIAMTN